MRHRAEVGSAAPAASGGPATWVRRNGAALLPAAGLIVLAFIAGMAVAELRLFPSTVLRDAAEAAQDWRQDWRHYLRIRSKYAMPTGLAGGGVTVHDPAAAYPGHTLITGYRDGHYRAFLIDMDGTVRHEWDVTYGKVWPDPSHLEVVPPDFDATIHGTALLPDGALVVSFEGLGAAKLDRCSRVLWRVPAQTHHAVEALPTGEFLIPARRRLARPGPGLPGVRITEGGWLWEDVVLRVGPQGRVVAEIPLLERLLASGLEGVLYANGLDSPGLGHTEDPLHLNDVEALPEGMAGAFPLFAAGDVMVSLRNLDTIAVLDRGTLLVKWWMTGPFLRQHDPDFLPNGNILVFDNRKGGPAREFGFSRILEIDPVARRVVWSYAGSEGEPFYTDALGKVQSLPNGNVLVAVGGEGRVFEVARTPEGGRIVWEWINKVGEGLVGRLTQAERVPAEWVGSLGQPCG
jgi:hypothetical protein